MSQQLTEVSVRPVSGSLGAEVRGLDLRQTQPMVVRDEVVRALHRHGVLFFPEQDIDDASQKEFARWFGPLKASPGVTKQPGVDPEILVLDTDVIGIDNLSANWHSDATWEENPAFASVLRSPLVPEYGGDTGWVGMYAAYQALSDRMKNYLLGLEAVHSNECSAGTKEAMGADKITKAVHPVVVKDPVTEQLALYVSPLYTTEILGVPRGESRSILEFLFAHIASPTFQVRLRWTQDTVVVWNERITLHIAIPDQGERVIRHRATVMGNAPVPA